METMLLGNPNQTYQQIKEIMAMVPFYSEELIANKLMAIFSEEASAYIGVLNALSVPVFIKGFESGYLFVNQAYCDLMKVSAADLIGKKTQDVYGWSAADNEIHLRMDIELLKTKKARIYESTVTNGLHEPLRLRVKKDLITTQEGHVTVILGELTAVDPPEKIEKKVTTSPADSRLTSLMNTQEHLWSDVEALAPEQAYQRILAYTVDLLGKPCSANYAQVVNEDLVLVLGHGYPKDKLAGSTYTYKETIQWLLTRDNPNRILRIDDYDDLPEIMPQLLSEGLPERTRSSLFVPIQIEGKVAAYLNLDAPTPRIFDADDVELLNWFKLLLEKQLEIKHLRHVLNVKTKTDSKTGLLCRTEFERQLEQVIVEAKQNAAEIYMVYADLLGLHRINQLGGWALGDLVIQTCIDQVSGGLDCILFAGTVEGDKFAFVCSSSVKTQFNQLQKAADQLYGRGIDTEKGKLHVPLALALSPYEARFAKGSEWQLFAKAMATGEKEAMRPLKPFFVE